VTFCSGKRAGKELRAPDPYTVEYELEEPFSSLLLQLTIFTNAIINKENPDRLGKVYGINGIDGAGPWCFVSWRPRDELVLPRHDDYRWGPAMYQNPGPVHFDRIVIKIVPEESSRLAAILSGTFDYTSNFPPAFIDQARQPHARTSGGSSNTAAGGGGVTGDARGPWRATEQAGEARAPAGTQ